MRDTWQSQSGTAYFVSLMVLVLMTLVGLSLSLVTQTEMLIGSNERTINRVFYAADAGVGVATAQALSGGRYTAQTFTASEVTTVNNHKLAERVESTPFVPILWEPCAWCPINEGKVQFYKVNHAVTVKATRLGWTGSGSAGEDAVPQARKTIGVMIEFQPWWEPPTDSIADPTMLQKVRY